MACATYRLIARLARLTVGRACGVLIAAIAGRSAMVTIYEHPLSPYAQKVKIALREKGVPFEVALPGGLGAGGAVGDFVRANPRAEVPALIDGDAEIFDSTIILEYIEDKWPTPPLLPPTPAARAKVRMIE